jgi:hypothetical protein
LLLKPRILEMFLKSSFENYKSVYIFDDSIVCLLSLSLSEIPPFFGPLFPLPDILVALVDQSSL